MSKIVGLPLRTQTAISTLNCGLQHVKLVSPDDLEQGCFNLQGAVAQEHMPAAEQFTYFSKWSIRLIHQEASLAGRSYMPGLQSV